MPRGVKSSLVNQIFGKLTVIERDSTKRNRVFWKCLCVCGTISFVSSHNLRSGGTESCGCQRQEKNKIADLNFIGQKFGRLLVVEKTTIRTSAHTFFWKCLCDCGDEVIVSRTNLQSGHTMSCGCYNKDQARLRVILPDGTAACNRIFRGTQNRAKKLGVLFSLTKEEFIELTKKNCFYCNSAPTPYAKRQRENAPFIANGLDRVDNIKGYEIGNVVPCCTKCNSAKNDGTKEEFFAWALGLAQNLYDKGLFIPKKELTDGTI